MNNKYLMGVVVFLILSSNSYSQITGTATICSGTSTALTALPAGGVWSSDNITVATIGSTTGVVGGVSAGTATINYNISGTVFSSVVTINPSPEAITGYTTMCGGATGTLVDATPGGIWISGNPAIASVGSSSGVVASIASGSAIITYTLTSGCLAIVNVHVVSNPPFTLPGCNNMGVGDTMTIPFASSCMVWIPPGSVMSSNPSVAMSTYFYNSVVGVSPGSTTILEFSGTTGCLTATKTITVTASAIIKPISGITTVCPGNTFVVSDAVPGGVWSSSATSVATISSAGLITTISGGAVTISYSMPGTGAFCATPTSVYLPPSPISGPTSMCVGDTVLLTSHAPGAGCSDILWGGFYSVSDTSKVKNLYSDNSGIGYMKGFLPGLDTISFRDVETGCAVSTTLTVNPVSVASPITGPNSVCTGTSITLSNPMVGGVWSVANTDVTAAGGSVTGVSAGIDTIRYTVSTSCGTVSTEKTMSVNAAPIAGIITGVSYVCAGTSIVLTDTIGGGEWNISNANAVISGGSVTGISGGIDTVFYSISNICGTDIATKVITVFPVPVSGTIMGADGVCVGSTITLTDASPGGIWGSSSATVVAGIVTGSSAGIDTISYTVSNVCGTVTAVREITINPLPAAGIITGATIVCVGASEMLSNTTAGGTWSCSNVTATVTGGMVTGVSPGLDTIFYSITNVCGTATAAKTVTVLPMSVAGTITGPDNVCAGSTITLTDASPGGIWSSSGSIASVSGGIVTGIIAGIDTISYAVTTTCGTATTTKQITVNPLPVVGVITGSSIICIDAPGALSDTIAGGTWSSSNASATVIGGLVTGVSLGIDTIVYSVTNVCGTATTANTVTVNPLPFAGAIFGSATAICVGDTATLSDTAPGGIWSSSNTDATIIGGFVIAITAGADIISYSVTNICGTATAIRTITINPLPAAYSLTGGGSYCAGGIGEHIGLGGSDIGIDYILYRGTTAVSLLLGTGSLIDFGLFTVAGIYSITAHDSITGCLDVMPGNDSVVIISDTIPVVTIFSSPIALSPGMSDTLNALVTGGGSSPFYQWYINGTAVTGATTSTYISNSFFYSDSISCRVTSSLPCGSIGSGYVGITFSVVRVRQPAQQERLIVYPNPGSGDFTVMLSSVSDEILTIVVTNLLGERIKEIAGRTNKKSKIVLDAPEGIYLITVITSDGETTKKILLERK